MLGICTNSKSAQRHYHLGKVALLGLWHFIKLLFLHSYYGQSLITQVLAIFMRIVPHRRETGNLGHTD